MPTTTPDNPLAHLSLGQATAYVSEYDASLLQGVPRALNRAPIGVSDDALPFFGIDEWTGYELSWLNRRGMPQVAIARCSIPVTSPQLVESKSFKLYLNSFNQTKMDSWDAVKKILVQDLSHCAGGPVEVELFTLQAFSQQPLSQMSGICLDSLDVEIEQYNYNRDLLQVAADPTVVSETLYSDLLKSNCLITNQPDWGSVQISYTGPQINHHRLLQYLVSFRNHNEFHEQCVERIFQDLMRHCQCQALTVAARYTRRGGLDINPLRSTQQEWTVPARTVRQ